MLACRTTSSPSFRFLPERRRRIDDDLAGFAIHDHGSSGRDSSTHVMQAHDRRHAERARKDGRMVRAASGVGREALDPRPIELGHDRRRQFVGDEHARRVEVLQPVARTSLLVTEVHPQTAGNILQVALAFVQVRVVDIIEHRGRFIECTLHRPFGIDSFVADDGGRPPDENRIVQHQQLSVEDRGEVRAASRRDPPSNLLELPARPLARAFEGRQLARYAVRSHGEPKYLGALDRYQRRAHCDTRRYADAGQALHDASPNPDSTSATSSSTARASSDPSALTVSVVPRDAASSKIPMMLFPSMTFESRPTWIRDSNLVARWTNFAAARACSPSWFTTVTDRDVKLQNSQFE
jgi:hypothetical protein